MANSSYVVSVWDNGRLVGLARVVSDDVFICFLQDILVYPDYQRQEIGTRVIDTCVTRYAHVRSKVLMTDDEQRQHLFYENAGFRNTKNLNGVELNTIVQMDGVE